MSYFLWLYKIPYSSILRFKTAPKASAALLGLLLSVVCRQPLSDFWNILECFGIFWNILE